MTQDVRNNGSEVHHYYYWDERRGEWVLMETNEVDPSQTGSPVKAALVDAADQIVLWIAAWLLALFFLGWIFFPLIGWLVEHSGLLNFMK